MTDETSTQEQQETDNQQESAESNRETTDAWTRVGQQFQILGDTIASAVTASFQSEESKQQLDKMRTEFHAAANQINQAVKDTVESEHGQHVRTETEKFARSAQESGQEVIQEIRPHMLAAFRSMQAGLDQIITNMETQQTKTTTESKPPESKNSDESTEPEQNKSGNKK